MVLEPTIVAALERDLRSAGLNVRRGEPLAQYTTFRIGGPADVLVHVHEIQALRTALMSAAKHGMPHLLLGGGSNILVGDRGFRGLVIRNGCVGVTIQPAGVDTGPMIVIAESGIGLAFLARHMAAEGLGGLAWAGGIPGTLGGAIVGNAGAFGATIADVTASVQCLDHRGEWSVWPKAALNFGYRASRLKGQQEWVVATVELRLSRSEPAIEGRLLEQYAAQRKARQPAGPSAGSVFKNPAGAFAGRLIEVAGLKGRRVGGAVVSSQHANFIINEGDACAADVLRLIELIREEVRRQTGVTLELEIELIGEF